MTERQGRRRLAVVIGAGSVKCAAALGMQRALQREGIGVDMLVGCSGGAMYAAVAALGWSVEEATQTTMRLWTREVTGRRNRLATLQAIMPRLFRFKETFGMRDDRLVLERLQAAFGDLTFADTRIPLYVTATDFRDGEQVVLSAGSLRDAIRASIAIPFVLPPVQIDGRLLVDGYLSDPLPVNVAMREGADVILALGFEAPYQRKISTPARFAFQLSSIMTNNLLRSRFAFHTASHHSELIAIVPAFKHHIGLFATEQIPYVIEEGERAMEQHLPYLRRLLASDPGP
jgi:NTE family protein